MDFTVLFPQIQMHIAGMLAEQRAFQSRVVPENHGERVEAEDITCFDPLVGYRIVRSIGIDARLKPCPGIHQFHGWEGIANLANHGIG